jgi:hypothetical protein
MGRNAKIKAKEEQQSKSDKSIRKVPMKDAVIRDYQMRDTGRKAKIYATHKL